MAEMRADSLASRLKRLRAGAGLTQPQLSAKAGLGRGTVAMIETGRRGVLRPSLMVLRKLAAALGVPLSRLIGEEGR